MTAFDEALYTELTKTPPTLSTKRLTRILEDTGSAKLSPRAQSVNRMEFKARGVLGANLSQDIDWGAPVAIEGKGVAAQAINWAAIISTLLADLPQILALFGGL